MNIGAAIGSGEELLALKETCGHGRWKDYVSRHIVPLGMSPRTVERCMQIAKERRRLAEKRLPLLLCGGAPVTLAMLRGAYVAVMKRAEKRGAA